MDLVETREMEKGRWRSEKRRKRGERMMREREERTSVPGSSNRESKALLRR